MAASIQIGCINQSDNSSDHITHVGGKDNGTSWKKTVAKVVSEIEYGTHKYHVGAGIYKVNVIVSTSANGNKYLRTEGDDTEGNNLLNLPECP